MKLRFGQVEQVLAAAHAIPDEDRSRFRSRLRNMFRVGPELKLPAGRVGRRANYGPDDLFKLALAVEFLQTGMSPEATDLAVSRFWPQFRIRIAIYRSTVKKILGNLPTQRHWQYYLMLDPAMLSSNIVDIECVNPLDIVNKIMGEEYSTRSRLILISIGAIVTKIEKALEFAGIDPHAFEIAVDDGDKQRLGQSEAAAAYHGRDNGNGQEA